MGENILENVKEKFASARTSCPGMSEEVYALTDYISEVSNDELIPEGLIMTMALVMDDLINNRCGFAPSEGRLPEYLESHNQQALAQLPYVIQVVDAIADEEFATSFRKLCKEILGFNVPKRVAVTSTSKYPENVTAAINWWAEAIQAPALNEGGNSAKLTGLKMRSAGHRRQFTAEEIELFKNNLAKLILEELNFYGHCKLYVDYIPCDLLAIAGKAIGISYSDITTFPWKTGMMITADTVTVRGEIIWSKQSEIDTEEHSAPTI